MTIILHSDNYFNDISLTNDKSNKGFEMNEIFFILFTIQYFIYNFCSIIIKRTIHNSMVQKIGTLRNGQVRNAIILIRICFHQLFCILQSYPQFYGPVIDSQDIKTEQHLLLRLTPQTD